MGEVLKTAAEFLPPVTAATALLYYFGWARSEVQAKALGVDTSVLDMTALDYMLRSVSSLYLPLGVVAAVVLGGMHTHRWIVAVMSKERQRPRLRACARLLSLSWLVLPLAALPVEWATRLTELVVPLAIAVGVVLTMYAVRLRALLDARDGVTQTAAPRSTLHTAVVGVLVVLALFWEVSEYAGVVGRGLAADVIGNLHGRLSVTVYSAKTCRSTRRGYRSPPSVAKTPPTPSATPAFACSNGRAASTSCCPTAGRRPTAGSS
ncbi:hypothetical protein [Nonomuraea sp. NPDC049607]|uniref:hypothetical protein n=1 Tax=Nonomuraea sp. NPDC049607 TaxID=3154732 RepID=UPI003433D9AF